MGLFLAFGKYNPNIEILTQRNRWENFGIFTILSQNGKMGKYFNFCKFLNILKLFENLNFNNLKIDQIKN